MGVLYPKSLIVALFLAKIFILSSSSGLFSSCSDGSFKEYNPIIRFGFKESINPSLQFCMKSVADHVDQSLHTLQTDD